MNKRWQEFLNKITQSGKSLFLLDGVGALLSAFFLGVVLRIFQPSIGMPQDILIMLALSACAFACYSLACSFLVKDKWPIFLRVIMVVNALYALFSLGLVYLHFEQLTVLGVTYFVLELIVLAVVVGVEYMAIRNSKKVQ